MKKIILLSCALMFGHANASNGVFAINDICDAFGCFPGDSSGFPITITEPGSYQLTSNIVSSSTTTDVIQINADNVTLDLNGFSIIGPRTCTGDNTTLVCTNNGMTAHGVSAVSRKNVKVKNGTVKGFDTGISLTSSSSRGNVAENIHSSENEFGFSVINGMVSNCVANRNLDTGISNGLFSRLFVKDSYAVGNRNFSIIAITCSNVYLSNNGADNCLNYTNGSTCGSSLCP
ncbi:hypothetical protein [Marinicella litoralis]|uniref:Parallel beta helix pectate lyase-like protein n=1 Tax=Marinicella litoralis TaxID=644220 RepID=A0A4R6XIX6_9GAMM|nr:hypothetical protein [Marinicella litoralis]TDR19446.1 hypothetical protein C8D91_2002 [Marinicella litoralis]